MPWDGSSLAVFESDDNHNPLAADNRAANAEKCVHHRHVARGTTWRFRKVRTLDTNYVLKCTKFRIVVPLNTTVAVALYSKRRGDDIGREIHLQKMCEGCLKAIGNKNLNAWCCERQADSPYNFFRCVQVIDLYSRCLIHHAAHGLILERRIPWDTPNRYHTRTTDPARSRSSGC